MVSECWNDFEVAFKYRFNIFLLGDELCARLFALHVIVKMGEADGIKSGYPAVQRQLVEILVDPDKQLYHG